MDASFLVASPSGGGGARSATERARAKRAVARRATLLFHGARERGAGEIEKLFRAGGAISRELKDYEFRPQQLELALAVERELAFEGQRTLAAEAPPGIGKTFALLAPAMLHVKKDTDEDARVLVLTAGITLQEQLIKKDLPILNKILKLDMPFGLLKGRRNYVCLRQAATLDSEGYLDFNDGGSASLLISEWLKRTETGDIAELALPPTSPAVLHIASSSKGCFGARCPFSQSCFVHKNFRAAQDWKIVVANYHLFFSHALLGNFPIGYKILICDEAHRMSDAARSVATIEASGDDARRLLRPRAILPHEAFFKKNSVDMKEILTSIETARKIAEPLFDSIKDTRDGEGMTERDEALSKITKELSSALDTMTRPLRLIEDADNEGAFRDPLQAAEAAEILNWKREVKEFQQSLLWCAEVKKFPEWAYWRAGNALNSAPVKCPDTISSAIHVGGGEKFFMISATLAIEDDFSFWVNETGITPDKTLIVGSPFDFEEQMKGLVVPIEEKVGSPEYDAIVARVVEKMCETNGGRTLVLLSSLRLLRRVAAQVRRKPRKFEVLVQGDLPQAELLRKFREDETSVLIGSVSFREGVDIPGEGLTQVIIDRIPFPHPFDPLTVARNELEGRDAFMRVTLPLAKMFLRQAVGRLIRKRTDHGQVVILDGRVLDRREWKVRECLPKAKFIRISLKI